MGGSASPDHDSLHCLRDRSDTLVADRCGGGVVDPMQPLGQHHHLGIVRDGVHPQPVVLAWHIPAAALLAAGGNTKGKTRSGLLGGWAGFSV